MVTHFQRPIWLTETACPNDGGALATQISYMRNAAAPRTMYAECVRAVHST